MKIAISSDHAGYLLKNFLLKELNTRKFSVTDLGTNSLDPVDYPDFSAKVAHAVVTSSHTRGIMICGSGVGASIAANKIVGCRAAICHDTYSAHQGVEHDDMNVLVLGARIIGEALALEICLSFLGAQFSNEERHQRRLKKIMAMEQQR